MTHFFILALFAALVGIVFGAVSNGTMRARTIYGLKIFGQFIGAGLALGWILYFVPFGK